jgi:hypothetical protein
MKVSNDTPEEAEAIDATGAKLVSNVWVTLIARFAIIGATCFMPIAGWLMVRAVNSVDQIASKVDSIGEREQDTNFTVKLIQQTQNQQTGIIADHESRVRTLEKINAAKPN